MKVGIDARFLTHPQLGGFKSYTVNLISALSRIDSENEYILYLDRHPNKNDFIPASSNFHSRVVSMPPVIGLPWREQVKLPRQAVKDRIDLFHSPCLTAPLNIPFPLVITVHDMIWASPKYFTSRSSWSLKRRLIDWYNYLIPKYVIKHASGIITVSNNSKQSILETLDIKTEQIYVTYEAANKTFQSIDNIDLINAVRNKYMLPPNFILALGAADPRKNIKILIEAYSCLPVKLREKYKLAIVWAHPFLASEILKLVEDLSLQNSIHFLYQIPNEDLALLYNAASLFVFPSLQEGFGLPLLEAMSCGAPVIAADNSSIPEIVGDATVLFDAQNVNEISSAMRQVLMDDSLRLTLSKRGLERATNFSWDKCARETIRVYNMVNRQ